MCKEGLNIFESQCKGLCMFKDDKFVVIDSDSCYNESYKVLYRKQKKFVDGSFLNYDEVLICGDKKLLCDIADAIKKRFD